MALIVALIASFVVAVVVTPGVARVATRLGVVDHPGPLKVHDRPVPYLGGVAVFVALGGVVAVERVSLLIPLALALAVGVADDVFDLSVRFRLPAEIVVGVCAAAVVPVRGALGALVTVVFVVVLCNAVNLLDGLDGLASGVGAVSAIGFAVLLDGQLVGDRARSRRRVARVPRVEPTTGAHLPRRRGQLPARHRARTPPRLRVGSR